MSCWDRELTKTEAAGNCSQTPSLPQPCCRGRRAKASLIRRQRSVPAPISSPFRHRIARGLPRRLPACMLPPPSRYVCVSPRFSIVPMRSTSCLSTTSARPSYGCRPTQPQHNAIWPPCSVQNLPSIYAIDDLLQSCGLPVIVEMLTSPSKYKVRPKCNPAKHIFLSLTTPHYSTLTTL